MQHLPSFLQRLLWASFAVCWLVLGAPAAGLAAVPGNLENDILYYIVVDRFFDGEPGNNIPDFAFPLNGDLDPAQRAYNQLNRAIAAAGFDPTRRYVNLRWGGDLDGIIQKLDYLQDLGVTKLVLSPIQDSTNGLIYSPSSNGVLHTEADPQAEFFDRFYAGAMAGFQGQWLKDWFEVDEHFRHPQAGDRLQTFRQLLDAAGDRGIGIILSLPLNGTSPYEGAVEFPQYAPDRFGQWFVDDAGVYRHGEKLATYWNPSGKTNPQGWFHPPTPINYLRPDPVALERAAIGGIPDLAQENPAVAGYLLDAARFWLQANPNGRQVAGFYLTEIPNISLSFWQQLEAAVKNVNPEAILIGEYPGGGYQSRPSIRWFARTQHYSLLNYDLSVAARRFFSRDRAWDGRTAVLRKTILGREGLAPFLPRLVGRLLNISNILEVPPASLAAVTDAEARGWVTCIENHDLPRLQTADPQVSDTAYASLLRFILASPGVPMLAYGVETGLAMPYHIDHRGLLGVGSDPYNQPMAIWPGDTGWNAALHETTRRLVRLRRQYETLRYGPTRFLFPQGSRRDADIFMLRESAGTDAAILYAYSTAGGKFRLPEFAAVEVEELDAAVPNLLAEPDTLAIQLAPEESEVFVLKKPIDRPS